jgi:hypothetical protein
MTKTVKEIQVAIKAKAQAQEQREWTVAELGDSPSYKEK